MTRLRGTGFWAAAVLSAAVGSALADDAPKQDAPRQGAEQFLGRWELVRVEQVLLQDLGAGIPKKYRCEHHYFPGGLWGLVMAGEGGKPTVSGGRWEEKDGLLTIRSASGKAIPPAVWLPQALLDDQVMRPAEPEPVVDPNWAWIMSERTRWERGGETTLRIRAEDPAMAARWLTFGSRDGVTAEQLVGSWTADALRMEFREDGSFRQVAQVEGRESDLSGTWRLADGLIEVVFEGVAVRKLAPMLVDALHLLSDLDGDGRLEHVQLERGGTAPPPRGGPAPVPPPGSTPAPTPPAPTPQGVVGVWVAPTEDGQAKVTFRDDGTYAREWPEGGAVKRFRGTYAVKGDALVVEDEEDKGETMKVPFRRIGADELELTIEGTVVRFRREGAPAGGGDAAAAPLPAALHGTWLVRDETGSVRLDLLPDGRFALALEKGQERWRYAGPCGVRGGVIEGKDETTGNPVGLPFRQADADTLVVTLNDVELRLKRQGAPPAGTAGAEGTPSSAESLPPGALGTWSGQQFTVQGFDAGTLSVTFRGDKTYAITWRLPGTVIPRVGTYKVVGRTVTLMAKNELPITVEFRLGSDGLTLDALPGMQAVTLARQP